MKTILLGGSNSIMKDGLNKSLNINNSLINLALGASGSLQNLFQLLKNKDLFDDNTLVVTESNVNDSFNIHTHGIINKDIILNNIDFYYSELSKTSGYILVIIMPIREYLNKTEPEEIIKLVWERHLDNINKYGFYFIDLYSHFLKLDYLSIKYIMPDSRHVIQSYMYNMGIRIINYFKNAHLKKHFINNQETVSHELFLPTEECDLQILIKNNSFFKEKTIELDYKFKIPEKFEGMKLSGIGTWSDNTSALKLENRNKSFLKKFNNINAFNEVIEELIIDRETYLSSIYIKSPISEKSINVNLRSEINSNVHITGLLFRLENNLFNNELENLGINLKHLIPKIEPYKITMQYYLKNNQEYLYDLNLDINKISELAKRLQKSSIEDSILLHQIIQSINPSKNNLQRLNNLRKQND